MMRKRGIGDMDLRKEFGRITERFMKSRSVKIGFGSLNSLEEIFIRGLVIRALSHMDRLYLLNTVELILTELLVNAEKAQMKRFYLQSLEEEGDDLNEIREEPERSRFFRFYKKNKSKMREKVKSKIRFEAKIDSEGALFSVISDGEPLQDEIRQIRDRIKAGEQYDDLNSVARNTVPTNEGGGFGLAVSLLALKKARLPIRSLRFEPGGGKTRFRLRVPGKSDEEETENEKRFAVLRELDSLPPIPEKIARFYDLTHSDTGDREAREEEIRHLLKEISEERGILKEIGLMFRPPPSRSESEIEDHTAQFPREGVEPATEDRIKIDEIRGWMDTGVLLNGSLYRRRKRMGAILLFVGSLRILLQKNFPLENDLRARARQVSFYALSLARYYDLKEIEDDAFAAALFLDLGKIVLYNRMAQREAFETIIRDRNPYSRINMEEFATGISHPHVGKLLAEKWNFPESITEAIQFHHSPGMGSVKYRKLLYTLHLADSIADYEQRKIGYFALDPHALNFFNLASEEAFEMVAAKLNSDFYNARM